MIVSNVRIFSLLVRREIKGMQTQLFDMLINGCIIAISQAVLYGYFMPQVGMSQSMVPLMYMGTIMMLFIDIGGERLFRDSFDLATRRFIDYQLTLPISRFWLFASFAIAYCIELTLQAFIPTIVGALFIKNVFSLSHINFIALIAVHCASMFFCALLFLTLTYSFKVQWIIDNVWPRLFIPLMFLGAVYYPWAKVNAYSRVWGTLFLCNPFTYIVEGFRGAMMELPTVIPWWKCVGVLSGLCILLMIILQRSVKSMLDPV